VGESDDHGDYEDILVAGSSDENTVNREESPPREASPSAFSLNRKL
jgi:hypothetical protein